jgi:hypothetical protein
VMLNSAEQPRSMMTRISTQRPRCKHFQEPDGSLVCICMDQTAAREQLWQEKAKKAPPSAQEQQAIQVLKSDSQMRAAFINKIAAPIANKMFERGMIPYLPVSTHSVPEDDK